VYCSLLFGNLLVYAVKERQGHWRWIAERLSTQYYCLVTSFPKRIRSLAGNSQGDEYLHCCLLEYDAVQICKCYRRFGGNWCLHLQILSPSLWQPAIQMETAHPPLPKYTASHLRRSCINKQVYGVTAPLSCRSAFCSKRQDPTYANPFWFLMRVPSLERENGKSGGIRSQL
jgi:hypothetical protein